VWSFRRQSPSLFACLDIDSQPRPYALPYLGVDHPFERIQVNREPDHHAKFPSSCIRFITVTSFDPYMFRCANHSGHRNFVSSLPTFPDVISLCGQHLTCSRALPVPCVNRRQTDTTQNRIHEGLRRQLPFLMELPDHFWEYPIIDV
jgi:hypothetical protein